MSCYCIVMYCIYLVDNIVLNVAAVFVSKVARGPVAEGCCGCVIGLLKAAVNLWQNWQKGNVIT